MRDPVNGFGDSLDVIFIHLGHPHSLFQRDSCVNPFRDHIGPALLNLDLLEQVVELDDGFEPELPVGLVAIELREDLGIDDSLKMPENRGQHLALGDVLIDVCRGAVGVPGSELRLAETEHGPDDRGDELLPLQPLHVHELGEYGTDLFLSEQVEDVTEILGAFVLQLDLHIALFELLDAG